MRISQAAFDLIVTEEVSSEATYRKKYTRPEWPGASSGVTVGIGYDLGQTSAATIRADWQGRVPAAMLDVMVACAGFTGEAGRQKTIQVRSKIEVPWETAIAVHKECVLPRWEAKVAAALPNTDKLSPDSFGALVSLTFNRGPSFSNQGERYTEMRAIRAHMSAQNFAEIPDEFRSMKRLWPTLAGLQKRREREAELFMRGLSGAPATPPVPTTNFEVLYPGSKHADVAKLKTWIIARINGEDGYGKITEGAVRAFQEQRGFKVDGIVGNRETWPALKG